MLGAVTSYTCPTDKSICYSVNSPETNATFQDLQMQANRFARVANFGQLSVDGLIGNGTVDAVKKALSYASSHLPDGEVKANVIALGPFAASRQLLAPHADGISGVLRNAAIALGLASVSGGGGGGGGGTTLPPPIVTVPPGSFPSASAGISSGFWAARSPTEKALMGVGAAVGLGSLLIVLVPAIRKRRRAKAG